MVGGGGNKKGRSGEGGGDTLLQSKFPLPPPLSYCTSRSAELRISFTQSAYTAREGDQVASLEVAKSGLTTSDIIVDLEVEDISAEGIHNKQYYGCRCV